MATQEPARKVQKAGSGREMKYLNEFQNLVIQIILFSLHRESQFFFVRKLEQNEKKLSG